MPVPGGWLFRSVSKLINNSRKYTITNISISESLVFIADIDNKWSLKDQTDWEVVSKTKTEITCRLKVINGWIVKVQSKRNKLSVSTITGNTNSESMIFIVDNEHNWKDLT
jgi:hypothetical protein